MHPSTRDSSSPLSEHWRNASSIYRWRLVGFFVGVAVNAGLLIAFAAIGWAATVVGRDHDLAVVGAVLGIVALVSVIWFTFKLGRFVVDRTDVPLEVRIGLLPGLIIGGIGTAVALLPIYVGLSLIPGWS